MSSPPWPVQSLPLPLSPFCASVGARNAKVGERVHALDGFQVHAAAETAIAAVGAAEGHEFLAPETDAAAAAVAGLHLEFGFVDEFHRSLLNRRRSHKQKGARLPCPFELIGLRAAARASLLRQTTLT